MTGGPGEEDLENWRARDVRLSTTPDSLYSSHPGDISGETFTLELFRMGPRVSTAADLQGEWTLQNVEAEVKCLASREAQIRRSFGDDWLIQRHAVTSCAGRSGHFRAHMRRGVTPIGHCIFLAPKDADCERPGL